MAETKALIADKKNKNKNKKGFVIVLKSEFLVQIQLMMIPKLEKNENILFALRQESETIKLV